MPADVDDFDLDPHFDLQFHHSVVTGVLGLMKRQCTHKTMVSAKPSGVRVNVEQCSNKARAMVGSQRDPMKVDYLCLPCTLVAIERAEPEDVLIIQRLPDRE